MRRLAGALQNCSRAENGREIEILRNSLMIENGPYLTEIHQNLCSLQKIGNAISTK